MSATIGYIAAGLQLGLNSILVRPKRGIATLIPQITLEEIHHDTLEITDHPVQQGAVISDHAFKRPAEVIIRCGWSDSPSTPGLLQGLAAIPQATIDGVQSLITGNEASQIRDTYKALLALQEKREPFDVFTGKRAYKDMLIRELTVTTDRQTENLLMVTATLRQVIIVSVQTVRINSVPKESMSDPESSVPVSSLGTKRLIGASNFNWEKLGEIPFPLFGG